MYITFLGPLRRVSNSAGEANPVRVLIIFFKWKERKAEAHF